MDNIVLGIYRSKIYKNTNSYHGFFFQSTLISNSIHSFYCSFPVYESPSERHHLDQRGGKWLSYPCTPSLHLVLGLPRTVLNWSFYIIAMSRLTWTTRLNFMTVAAKLIFFFLCNTLITYIFYWLYKYLFNDSTQHLGNFKISLHQISNTTL